MTINVNQKGTQTATIGTEHTLAQNSSANDFQYTVDTTAMVNGDILELRVYRIINSSAIQLANAIYANVQANPLKEYKYTGSQGVVNGIKVTLKQTAGTGRAFDWELLADSGNAAANVTQWNGTNVSSPATAGIPDVNVKNINNVATTSVTTISANQGTTQPINFTGTAGSALAKSDMVDVAGAAVSTTTAQLGVAVVSVAGAASNVKANQALNAFPFLMRDSTTHAPKTGLTVTATRSINGAAFAACANSPTETSSGWYQINLAAADLNGNTIALRFTATAADDTDAAIITQP